MKKTLLTLAISCIFLTACNKESTPRVEDKKVIAPVADERLKPESEDLVPVQEQQDSNIQQADEVYAKFTLTTDLSHLSDNQRKMLPKLIDISKIMDELFWLQSYGPKEDFLASVKDSNLNRLVDINYGPWDRLGGDKALIESYGEKSLGANFYPKDMTKEEFEASSDANKKSLYTVLRRNDAGELHSQFYHEEFPTQLAKASELLLQAAELADDAGFKKYLTLRAQALLDDQFRASDMAWMDMKSNDIDFVVGPIESYEDQLFGYKTAYEAYVLIKDKSWSERLAKFAKLLPILQEGLPVADEFKTETPGTDSDLNAYDVLYYAGHSNAGSKTIAINLPNDETVQLEKGSRRLQLKNAMQAKFDKILVPISEVLVDPSQRKHITFDAFFGNTMFHEVAHGLGIKNTITGKGTVTQALKQFASAQEEGKADILGLYMVEKLFEMGELTEGEVMDNYVTFMAGIFRSVRFGSSSAHGIANMLRFNYFSENEGFNYNETTGFYSVNPEKMSAAIKSLSNKILTLQGNGDYDGVEKWVTESGNVSPALKAALDRLSKIPTDIVFEQGVEVLGL
jgi:hypothetical protein